jgi:hypothetical protein
MSPPPQAARRNALESPAILTLNLYLTPFPGQPSRASPARFAPHVFSENKVYGVLSDDLDVQYVVRLRIVGTG